MDKNTIYYKQVQLLVRLLPFIAKENCFALKGGTAINLFLRELPRLSVDIDLAYLPLEDRNTTLKQAGEALNRISEKIKKAFPNIQIQHPNQTSNELRLLVKHENTKIKIELSPVIRGSVFPPETRELCKHAEEIFGYVNMPVMSFSDIYAGKICAALDRQHPRDLFDIKLLLENEGIDDNLRKTFLVYLISHSRPLVELLNPNLKDIQSVYTTEFLNMTETEIPILELKKAREQLILTIFKTLTKNEKDFLISFKCRSPNWSLLGLDGIKDLPAVKWKLLNLKKMTDTRHRQALKTLKEYLKVQ